MFSPSYSMNTTATHSLWQDYKSAPLQGVGVLTPHYATLMCSVVTEHVSNRTCVQTMFGWISFVLACVVFGGKTAVDCIRVWRPSCKVETRKLSRNLAPAPGECSRTTSQTTFLPFDECRNTRDSHSVKKWKNFWNHSSNLNH